MDQRYEYQDINLRALSFRSHYKGPTIKTTRQQEHVHQAQLLLLATLTCFDAWQQTKTMPWSFLRRWLLIFIHSCLILEVLPQKNYDIVLNQRFYLQIIYLKASLKQNIRSRETFVFTAQPEREWLHRTSAALLNLKKKVLGGCQNYYK